MDVWQVCQAGVSLGHGGPDGTADSSALLFVSVKLPLEQSCQDPVCMQHGLLGGMTASDGPQTHGRTVKSQQEGICCRCASGFHCGQLVKESATSLPQLAEIVQPGRENAPSFWQMHSAARPAGWASITGVLALFGIQCCLILNLTLLASLMLLPLVSMHNH